jgi:integrase
VWKTRGRPAEPDLAGLRDRALLLVGFFAALRRSELSALTIEQITEHPGLVLALPHSKTNQQGLEAVADMIKRRAEYAGDFAGHSLRAGFAPEAYAQGTPELAIMRHGRWRSASVMRGYVEEGSIWNNNAAQRLGL